MVLGEDLATAAIPPDRAALALYQIRKPHLKHLGRIADLPLTHLELRWFSAPDLTDLPLPASVRSLIIWHSPRLKSVAGIERALALEELTWMDTGRLEDAAALARLPKLRRLTFEAGMSVAQKIASLGFLAGLDLEELVLDGIELADGDLAPVLDLPPAVRVSVHGRSFPPEDLARIAAARPEVMDDLLPLPDYQADLGMRCTGCGGVKKMLFLRGKKFLWCPDCEALGLQRNLDWFAGLVAEARASN